MAYDVGGTVGLIGQASSLSGTGSVVPVGPKLVYTVGTAVSLFSQRAVVQSITTANIHQDIGTPAELIAQAARVSASGATAVVGSAVLLAQRGQVLSVIRVVRSGQGALSAQAAILSGLSERVMSGSGVFVAASGAVSATVRKSSVASGALLAEEALVAGDGGSVKTAFATLQAMEAQLTGVGTHSRTGEEIGSGIHGSVGSAEVSANASVFRQGSSNLVAEGAVVSGEGIKSPTVLSANLIAQAATVQMDQSSEDLMAWEGDDAIWSQPKVAHARDWPVFVLDRRLYQADFGTNFDSEPVKVILERTGLSLIGRDRQGNWKADATVVKFVSGIWPLIRGTPGSVIKVYVGSQMTTEEAVSWEGPYQFVVGVTNFLDFTVSGCYIAVRFESDGQDPWELISYDLDLTLVGER